MKRFEMVKIIQQYLNNASDRMTCFTDIELDVIAQGVLRTVEENGMLPPLKEIGKTEKGTSIKKPGWE